MSDSNPPRVPLKVQVKRALLKAAVLLVTVIAMCAAGLIIPGIFEWLGSRFSPFIPLTVHLAGAAFAGWAFFNITLDTDRGRLYSLRAEHQTERFLGSLRVRQNASLRDSALIGGALLFGLFCASLITAGFVMRWLAILGWADFAAGPGSEPVSLSRVVWGAFALEHLLDAMLLGTLSNFGVHLTSVEPRGFVSNLVILVFKLTTLASVLTSLRVAYRTRNEMLDARKVDRVHYLELGAEAEKNEDWKQALAIYINGVREYPRSAELLERRARVYRQLDKGRRATADEGKALALRERKLNDDPAPKPAPGPELDTADEAYMLGQLDRIATEEHAPAELPPEADDETVGHVATGDADGPGADNNTDAHLPYEDDPGIPPEGDSGTDLAGFGERDPV